MRKIRLLILLFVGAALMWGPVSLQAMDKEANTIDELVSMFDESNSTQIQPMGDAAPRPAAGG